MDDAHLEVSKMTNVLELCRAVGDLVHATQRERGGSSVYLASGGARFEAQLNDLRTESDLAIESFLDTFDAVDAQQFLQTLEYATATRMLVRLAPTRRSVDRLDIEASQAIEYLTDLNEAMLVLCGTLIEQIPDTADRSRTLGLLALLRAKELTGAQRAVMAQVFTEDRFPGGHYLWSVALISAQETLLRVAVGGSEQSFATKLASINDADPSLQSAQLETAAFVNGVGDLGIDPADWFREITARIDLLKSLEDDLFAGLASQGTREGAIDHDPIISEAISATVLAMRSLRSQVDDVRHGELSLRDFLRGHGEALVQAEQQLSTALQTEELATRATRDELTGILNRSTVPALINAAFQRSLANDRIVGALMVDLDNFKVINDSLGHTVGDALLRSVAERLRRAIRSQDTAARVGGDEFVVVAPDLVDERDATDLAEMIKAHFAEPHEVEGRELIVDVSIGIGIGRSGHSPDRLLRDADLALHRAKSTQKGGIVLFDEALRSEMEQRHEIEMGLREALKIGTIRAGFQPIVDLGTGEVVVAEALARWDRDGEVVPAGEFYDVADQTGLLPSIDEAVTRTAFINRPTFAGAKPKVSVNVSDLQLRQPLFAERFREDMIAYGMPPQDVWVEVTEHLALSGDTAVSNLERLREMGCTIALDDFGSGYSALSVLRNLPLDVVKLDGLFVTQISRDIVTQATVGSVLEILGALDVRAVAEGVETKEQLDVLLELGCDMAQGFYLSKPSVDASTWEIPRIGPEIKDLAA